MAPERILGSSGNPKSDTWSWAIIVIEQLFGRPLWPTLNVSQMLRKILSLLTTKNVLEKIARENDAMAVYDAMDARMKAVLECCLATSLTERPTAGDILAMRLFAEAEQPLKYAPATPVPGAHLLRCPLKQIYCWWQLAGGDVQVELKRAGLIRSEAPILKMPM